MISFDTKIGFEPSALNFNIDVTARKASDSAMCNTLSGEMTSVNMFFFLFSCVVILTPPKLNSADFGRSGGAWGDYESKLFRF